MNFSQFSARVEVPVQETPINRSISVEGTSNLAKVYQGCSSCSTERIHSVVKEIVRCLTCGNEYKIQLIRK